MTPARIIRGVNAALRLDDLAEWPMLGPKIEAVKTAVRGGPGVSLDDVKELERYAARWDDLRSDLRAFYRVLCVRDETASVALWRILHGGGPLEPWQEGKLKRLWEEAVGYPPTIDLCPRRREW